MYIIHIYICIDNFSTILDKGLRKNIKKKKRRDGEIGEHKLNEGTSLVAQRIKRLPIIWETRVQSLGREDPLEKEMATHSSTLAWKIP